MSSTTTTLEALGYESSGTQGFSDPLDPRYRRRPFAASNYEEQSIRSTLSALGNSGANKQATALAKAENDFYATTGYPTESTTIAALETKGPDPVSGRATAAGSSTHGPSSSESPTYSAYPTPVTSIALSHPGSSLGHEHS